MRKSIHIIVVHLVLLLSASRAFAERDTCSTTSTEVEARLFEHQARVSSAGAYDSPKTNDRYFPSPLKTYLPGETHVKDSAPGYVFRTGDGVRSREEWHEIPSFEYLMRYQLSPESSALYDAKMALLMRLTGGKSWFRKAVSRDIRTWLMNYDYDFYWRQMPLTYDPRMELPNGVRAYELPDGTRVTIKSETARLLVDRWAFKFRPGNM